MCLEIELLYISDVYPFLVCDVLFLIFISHINIATPSLLRLWISFSIFYLQHIYVVSKVSILQRAYSRFLHYCSV